MESLENLPPLDLNLNLPNKNSGKILEFSKLRRELCPLIRILHKEPGTDLEKELFKKEPWEESQITDSLIQQCQELLQNYRSRWEGQKALEKALWERVLASHEELESKENPSLEFCNSRADLIETLQKLLQVQESAEVEKNSWIAKNIIEIRKELEETWSQCMVKSGEANFKAFTAINFSEELLELHKEELGKWKAYRERNQVLFDQIEKRAMLWEQMKELQAKQDDPNRFTNRGGVLLKSQKEMNYVNKALPKCEEKLISLAKSFEKENGRKLLLGGKPVGVKIAEDWKEYRESIFKRKTPVARTNSSQPGHDHPILSSIRSGSRLRLSKSCKDVSELGLKTGEKRGTIRPAPSGIKRCRLNEDFANAENCPDI